MYFANEKISYNYIIYVKYIIKLFLMINNKGISNLYVK